MSGVLEDVKALNDDPSPVARTRYNELLTLVVDDSDKRIRQVPTLYMGRSPIFGARDLTKVKERLSLMIEVIRLVSLRPTYMLTACEFNGEKGLCGRDFFNRSAYRSRLRQLGMRFSDHPVTYFNGQEFACDGWEAFVPKFVILRKDWDYPEDYSGVIRTTGGVLTFHLCAYRLQGVGAEELRQLTPLVR